MARDRWPGESVQLTRRRLRCVLDPMFCLSQSGAAFSGQLARSAEVWLGPEFLNILDNWHYYYHDPRRLDWPDADACRLIEVRDALQVWARLRDEAGHVDGPLCWVRDALRESRLPLGIEDTAVARWEALAEALDGRLGMAPHPTGPMVAAIRDAAALAGLLPGAILLSFRSEKERSLWPTLCRILQDWGLPCREVDDFDPLAARERGMLLDLAVETGLAGYLWAGLRIAVVHLVVPGQGRVSPVHALSGEDDVADFNDDEEPCLVKGPWDDAHAFWYELAPEDPICRERHRPAAD